MTRRALRDLRRLQRFGGRARIFQRDRQNRRLRVTRSQRFVAERRQLVGGLDADGVAVDDLLRVQVLWGQSS